MLSAVCRLPSGWLVIGDVQPLAGYCLLLADPVVPSLNALGLQERVVFLSDMALVGDVLLEVSGCDRVNYEIWGNSEPALHAHIMPRYGSEPEAKRRLPACMGYSWSEAPKSSGEEVVGLMARLRASIESGYRRQVDFSRLAALAASHSPAKVALNLSPGLRGHIGRAACRYIGRRRR